MSTLSLQVTYRKGKPFAAYLYLSGKTGQKSVRTEAFSSELLVDFDENQNPIGIEIVSPGAVSIEEIYQVFDKLGIGRPSREELKPLQAA